MILVTGAGGKTGQAVIRALKNRGVAVRAWLRRPPTGTPPPDVEWLAGDLLDPNRWRQACSGVRALYLICPNMHPQEAEIGRLALESAQTAGMERIVYHSVLHPQTENMPHHWNKLRVEEAILASGLPFTILQPAAYMQNVLGYWSAIVEEGVYRVPYRVTARLALVDLDDVAEAAARVLTEAGHEWAIYELAGPENLSQLDVAEILGQALGRIVRAEETPQGARAAAARKGGLNDYAVETLLAMFRYYDRHGLLGN
ncbi:MAG: NAD-dependent epimerase/dehydratase family protein, partial [Caldilineae bacterium]